MKTLIRNLFTCLGGASRAAWVLPALLAGFGLMPAGRVTAQTFTNLHSFTVLSGICTNSDGAKPRAGLILSGNTLYGTVSVSGGGSKVFALTTNGTDFTILHTFTSSSDGADPSELILSGNLLYGTANGGGSSGYGTLFAINT